MNWLWVMHYQRANRGFWARRMCKRWEQRFPLSPYFAGDNLAHFSRLAYTMQPLF